MWRDTPGLKMRRKDLFARWILMAGCSRLSWILARHTVTEDAYCELYTENHAGLRMIDDVQGHMWKRMSFEMKRVLSTEMEYSVDVEMVRWCSTVDNEETELKIPLLKMRFTEVQRE